MFGKTVVPYPFINGGYKIFGKDKKDGQTPMFMIGDEKVEVSVVAWVDNLENEVLKTAYFDMDEQILNEFI